MERLFFILNPVAGTGRGAKYFPQLRAVLDAKGVDYGYARSEHPGHAVELTRQAVAAGEKRIIAVGGDGTVNEVASALYGTGVVMGILPLGTGNDLARTLGLPTEPLEALDVVLNGQVRPMDAGMANDCFFINAAGYGFDVDVLQRVEKYKKRLNGMLPYLLGIGGVIPSQAAKADPAAAGGDHGDHGFHPGGRQRPIFRGRHERHPPSGPL